MNQFKGRTVILATMHGKEKVIAPILEKHLGVSVVIPKNFNSDNFGTFTGDVKRCGNQLEAARAKLYKAMEDEGADIGVSSEGSFGNHPSIPFIKSNLELLLFIDKKKGYEFQGYFRTPETNISGTYIKNAEEALDFARNIGFPTHGVIVKRNEHEKNAMHKDLQTEKEVIETVNTLLVNFSLEQIFIETDMRAHKNPTRMKAIEKATEDLVKNITSCCPNCKEPGFVMIDYIKGLQCSLCNLPTELGVYDVYGCKMCNHTENTLVTKYGKIADPKYCNHCNP